MKYFVNPGTGELFAFDQDADDASIPSSLNSLTQAEFEELVSAKNPTIDRAQQITATRYLQEISGIVVSGVHIDTDRESQAMVAGAALSAVIDPSYVCNWKTRSGPVRLDATQLIAVAIAVRNHVQACFDREFALIDLVEKGTFKEYLLEKGWPSSTE